MQRYNITITKEFRFQVIEEVVADSKEEAVAIVESQIDKDEMWRVTTKLGMYETSGDPKVIEVTTPRVLINNTKHFKKLLGFVRRTSLGSSARKSFLNCIITLNAMKKYSYADYELSIYPDYDPYSLSWSFFREGTATEEAKRGMNGGTILHGYEPEKDTVDYLYYTQEQLDKLSWGTHT